MPTAVEIVTRAVVACLACVAILGLSPAAEAAVTRSGTLQEIVIDRFQKGQSVTRYTLKSEGREIPVVPTDLEAESGDRVVVGLCLR